MPLAQAIRRWLWRLNGVMALLALAAWSTWLLRSFDTTPISIDAVAVADTETSPTWEDLVAVFRPFYGDPDAKPTPSPSSAPVPDGRLPLRAYRVACLYHDPGGNHGILLKSKDPAHPESFLPSVARAHYGIRIERVAYESRAAHVTVSRGEERVTYVLSHPEHAERRRFQTEPLRPRAASALGDVGLAASVSTTPRPDVKLLPFYGSGGEWIGGRVTGVRPGSALAQAGLASGDVIVGVDEKPAASLGLGGLRRSASARATSIDVLRGSDRARHRLSVRD